MPTTIRVLKRYWPILLVAAFVLVNSSHALAAIDIDLDQGFGEAESKIKRYLGRGLQLFGLVVCVIGISVGAFKLSQKDPSGTWYLVGTTAATGLFLVIGGMLG